MVWWLLTAFFLGFSAGAVFRHLLQQRQDLKRDLSDCNKNTAQIRQIEKFKHTPSPGDENEEKEDLCTEIEKPRLRLIRGGKSASL